VRQRPFRIPALGEDLDDPRGGFRSEQRAFRPRTTSTRSTSLVENAARLIAPPGSFMGMPSTSTRAPVLPPPRVKSDVRLPGAP